MMLAEVSRQGLGDAHAGLPSLSYVTADTALCCQSVAGAQLTILQAVSSRQGQQALLRLALSSSRSWPHLQALADRARVLQGIIAAAAAAAAGQH